MLLAFGKQRGRAEESGWSSFLAGQYTQESHSVCEVLHQRDEQQRACTVGRSACV